MEIKITSVFDREHLVAEIWDKDRIIAEINQESESLQIDIYSSNKNLYLDYDMFVKILVEAKIKLLSSPDNLSLLE